MRLMTWGHPSDESWLTPLVGINADDSWVEKVRSSPRLGHHLLVAWEVGQRSLSKQYPEVLPRDFGANLSSFIVYWCDTERQLSNIDPTPLLRFESAVDVADIAPGGGVQETQFAVTSDGMRQLKLESLFVLHRIRMRLKLLNVSQFDGSSTKEWLVRNVIAICDDQGAEGPGAKRADLEKAASEDPKLGAIGLSTLYDLLPKLVEGGFLSVEKRGAANYYTPTERSETLYRGS